MFVVVALPSDKVLKLSPEHPTIEYGFDFVVFLSINEDRIRWGFTPPSRNWIRRCRHQFDHRKDRV
jgi:hypothetical protein